MIPTREQAWDLLCEYNEGEFHRLHARIVGDVMRYFAAQLGYADEADFWQTVGILHDLDLSSIPTSTARRRRRSCANAAWTSALSMRSSATAICSPSTCSRSTRWKGALRHGRADRPDRRSRADAADKSVQDLQLKSLKKKFKDKKFAAGCSREVIERGADMLGWSLDELMERTITAMQASPAANGN